ncbi:hypothetical protein JD844_015121 [Phrynosoma platyrhinos]|uniref:Guanine nucleotide-binding protein subunit beta-like protein 1 n=1 Tax=Phrynosoma platyrhinos TaxID=52577 RepID=A0ABQ7T7H8_PHRPL|nr:hypothetical protein JD844_015121 [Phrynosoma platyrhinos]
MGKMLSRLACHQEPIMGLDFDSEKAKGASGSSEKMLCVWRHSEQQNLEIQSTFCEEQMMQLTPCAFLVRIQSIPFFSPDPVDMQIGSGLFRLEKQKYMEGRDQKICLWELAEGRETVMDSVSTENVGFCKCSLLEVAEKRWLLATPWKGLEELQQTYHLTNPGIAEVTLRQDQKILATAGWDHRIRLFGWKKLKPLAVLDYHTAAVHCVAFSDHSQPSERLMAAGSKDHRISVWSIYNQT